MAPIDQASVDDAKDIEKSMDQMGDLIQGLFQLMVQVSQYDNAGGRSSQEVVANEIKNISATLQGIHRTSTSPETRLPNVPQELFQYVENGRNPDIYTREFVELVRRSNQVMRGKMQAFALFRDVLVGEMRAVMPELSPDLDRIVAATSSSTSPPPPAPTAAAASDTAGNNAASGPTAAASGAGASSAGN